MNADQDDEHHHQHGEPGGEPRPAQMALEEPSGFDHAANLASRRGRVHPPSRLQRRSPGAAAGRRVTIPTVILLRGWIRRTLERRWVGLAMIVLLGVLLAFVVLHPISDELAHSTALVCAVVALLTTAVALSFQPPELASRQRTFSVRAPPGLADARWDALEIAPQLSPPLRR
jgi:hypothetical protein